MIVFIFFFPPKLLYSVKLLLSSSFFILQFMLHILTSLLGTDIENPEVYVIKALKEKLLSIGTYWGKHLGLGICKCTYIPAYIPIRTYIFSCSIFRLDLSQQASNISRALYAIFDQNICLHHSIQRHHSHLRTELCTSYCQG